MKKKILYIGGFELPDKNAAAQRVVGNGKAFRNLGNEVVFAGLTKSRPNNFQYQGFSCYEMAYPKDKKSWISFLFSIKEESKLVDSYNPDVIIFYNYPAFKFWLLKSRYKSKVIIGDVTEWYEASGFSLFSIIKRLDVWLRMKVIHPRIDGLIVISDYLEDFYKGKLRKLVNVPPLVDTDEVKWVNTEIPNPENSYNLVYAGSPGAGNKDRLDLVISAISEVRCRSGKNVKINIIGLDKKQFLESFNDFPRESIDESYIQFRGRVPHYEALNYVKNADYSIFLRDANLTNTAGFPTKFVESITAGTPVITNASSNLSDYFREYSEIGYLIEDLTVQGIAMSIELAINNSKEEIKRKKECCFNSGLFDYRKFDSDLVKLLGGT